MPAHQYEDVARHGSVDLRCRFCGVSVYSVVSDECPKAQEVLANEAQARELKERFEYNALLAAEARAIYLKTKYGGS